MSDETKVLPNEYKGHKLFAIFEVDEADEPIKQYPLISFGKKKAQAILKHLDELRDFVQEN